MARDAAWWAGYRARRKAREPGWTRSGVRRHRPEDDGPMAVTLDRSDVLVASAVAAVNRREPFHGGTYQFASELTWEDAVMAAVEAILSGADPDEAVAAANAEYRRWPMGYTYFSADHENTIAGPWR